MDIKLFDTPPFLSFNLSITRILFQISVFVQLNLVRGIGSNVWILASKPVITLLLGAAGSTSPFNLIRSANVLVRTKVIRRVLLTNQFTGTFIQNEVNVNLISRYFTSTRSHRTIVFKGTVAQHIDVISRPLCIPLTETSLCTKQVSFSPNASQASPSLQHNQNHRFHHKPPI